MKDENTLTIQMNSVPKLRFESVESTPENKEIANDILRSKLNDDNGFSNYINFFSASNIWKIIKSIRSMPLEMAINQNLISKDTTYESLIDRKITICDTIPKEVGSIDELIKRSLIKRLAYETNIYGTEYYIQSSFYEKIKVLSLTQKTIDITNNMKISYFIAEVNISRMLIKKK